MARSLAVIGVGNMASAIIAGISASDIDITKISQSTLFVFFIYYSPHTYSI